MPPCRPVVRFPFFMTATAVLVLATTAHAFEPVPFLPPKIGLEVHFEMRDGPQGKRVGQATHRVIGVTGSEITFTSASEQKLGTRTFKFDNVIVSRYGIAPREVSSGKSGTTAKADWKSLDAFWPLLPDKTVYLNFEVFRTGRGARDKPYMRGRSSFTAVREETITVLGEDHDTIVLERETFEEILAAKKPIKRRIRYRIWWSRKVHWMVRMTLSGESGGKRHERVVFVTKLVAP